MILPYPAGGGKTPHLTQMGQRGVLHAGFMRTYAWDYRSARGMLEHLIYLSKADPYLAVADVDAILRVSRRLNADRNITGALFFNAHTFVQVLEGDSGWLDILLASLRRDVRHSRVEVVHRAAIAGRNFGEWSMAYTDRLAPLAPLFDDMTPLESVLDGMRGDTRFVSGFIESVRQAL